MTPAHRAEYGLPFADYQKADGLNHSTLSLLEPTPAHARWALDHPDDDDDATPALKLGTTLHAAILEPGTLNYSQYIVKPEGMKFSTKEGKAWKADALHRGLTILSMAEFTALTLGVRNLITDKWCAAALRMGEPEVSLFWREGDVDRKARIDFVPDALPCLVDIKTVADASPEAFARSVFDWGWHRKAAWYLDGWNALHPEDRRDSFVWIVMEKKAPYLPAVYQCHPMDVAVGRQDNNRLVNTWKECIASGVWPGYTANIKIEGLPFANISRYLRRYPQPFQP